MKLRAALLFGITLALCAPASASTCSVPYSFSNGTIANANQVNANYSALAGCANSLDWANVGAGFWASNLSPTTIAQATFGGSQTYTFPAGLITNGDILGNGNFFAASGNSITLGPNASSASAFTIDTSGNATVHGGVTVNGTGFFTGNLTASSFTGAFNGSGAGLTNGSVPNSALATAPVTALSAGTGVSVGGGTTPSVGLSHGDYVTISPGSAQSGSVNVTGTVKPGAGSAIHAIAWGSCGPVSNVTCNATLSSPMADTAYVCSTSVVGNSGSQVVGTSYAITSSSVVKLEASTSSGSYSVSVICVE
jgi:hypothetical protein